VLWGATAIGYLRAPLNWPERCITAVAAILLVAAIPLTDQAGLALAGAFFIWHEFRRRRLARLPG
jgi:TRAP-type uncharacterized transport system fused permease subunit